MEKLKKAIYNFINYRGLALLVCILSAYTIIQGITMYQQMIVQPIAHREFVARIATFACVASPLPVVSVVLGSLFSKTFDVRMVFTIGNILLCLFLLFSFMVFGNKYL